MKTHPPKTRFWILCGVLLAAAGALAYAFLYDKIFAVVEGNVYRSAQLSGARLEEVIAERRIRTIVNLRGGSEGRDWYEVESDIARSMSVSLVDIRLPSHDLPDYLALNHLLDALLFSERPILVHCWQGADRSGLAGALAMAVLENPPLAEIKKQFSWRYGVLPFGGSIGARVFAQYENWLRNSGREHEREVLVDWIRNGYVDPRANLLFHIDEVNGRLFDKKEKSVDLDGWPQQVVVKGWALDAQTAAPPAGLSLSLGGAEFKAIDYQTRRPDVARFFGRNAADFDGFTVGWTVVFAGSEVGPGKHAFRLHYARQGDAAADIQTDFKLGVPQR